MCIIFVRTSPVPSAPILRATGSLREPCRCCCVLYGVRVQCCLHKCHATMVTVTVVTIVHGACSAQLSNQPDNAYNSPGMPVFANKDRTDNAVFSLCLALAAPHTRTHQLTAVGCPSVLLSAVWCFSSASASRQDGTYFFSCVFNLYSTMCVFMAVCNRLESVFWRTKENIVYFLVVVWCVRISGYTSIIVLVRNKTN